MTLEEAKKILEKEGFKLGGPGKPGVVSEAFAEYEAPKICEAMQIVCSAGFQLAMLAGVFDERKERLKKEYEQNTKAPDSAENRIKEDSDVNPALEEAATQFNDALLDEQAKKIAELTKENERLERVSKTTTDEFNELYYRMITKSDKIEALGKEIAKLNGIIHKKNLKIEELGKESSRHLEGKMKMFGENFGLEQKLKDKDAVLADVAEGLRLSKIREKNLTELCQKYIKANEELKEKLANKVVDKIDAQALKSAESALAYKEKVIAEKDEVIADLTHELKAKHKKYVWYKGAYDSAQQILNTIADYAAKHHDKKISDQMVEENHPTIDNPEEIEIEKAVKLVRNAMKEGHTVTIDYDKAEEGGDQSATTVECGKDIDDVFEEIKRLCQE